MDAEHRGNPGEHVDVQGEGAVDTRLPAPVMIGRARGVAERQAALLLCQPPEVCDCQERPQGWRAEAPTVRWIEPGRIEALRSGRLVSHGSGRADGHRAFSCPDQSIVQIWRSEEHTSELQSLMRISYA